MTVKSAAGIPNKKGLVSPVLLFKHELVRIHWRIDDDWDRLAF